MCWNVFWWIIKIIFTYFFPLRPLSQKNDERETKSKSTVINQTSFVSKSGCCIIKQQLVIGALNETNQSWNSKLKIVEFEWKWTSNQLVTQYQSSFSPATDRQMYYILKRTHKNWSKWHINTLWSIVVVDHLKNALDLFYIRGLFTNFKSPPATNEHKNNSNL